MVTNTIELACYNCDYYRDSLRDLYVPHCIKRFEKVNPTDFCWDTDIERSINEK